MIVCLVGAFVGGFPGPARVPRAADEPLVGCGEPTSPTRGRSLTAGVSDRSRGRKIRGHGGPGGIGRCGGRRQRPIPPVCA